MNHEVERRNQSNPDIRFDEIDIIFEKEGDFTKFNMVIYIWGLLVSLSVCWNLVMTVFTGPNDGWTCTKNTTAQFCMTNANQSFLLHHESFDERCKLQRVEWRYITDKTHSFVTEFDLICEQKMLAALLSSSFYIGGIIGAFFTGIIADKFGRKSVLTCTLLICSLASLSGYFIKSIWHLFISNIFAGGAQVGCFYTLFAYFLELVAPRKRTLSTSVLQIGLTVSCLLIDLISYLVQDWRKIKLYSSFPCLLPFVLSFAIPESPRWLLSKGRVDEAKFVLCKILSLNKSNQNVDSLTKPNEEISTTYKDLFRTLSAIIITISIAAVRFTGFSVYYLLILDSPYLGGDLYQSFALASLPDVVTCLAYPLYANRIGRRKALLGSLSITAVFSISMSFTPHNHPYRYYINMILLALAIFFSIAANCTLNTWTFEIFPTCLRARGMSFCIMFDRVGIAISPFVIHLLQGAHHNVPFYILFALCLLGVLIAYCVLPETRNRPTRENVEDFKGRLKKKVNRNVSSFENVVTEINVVQS